MTNTDSRSTALHYPATKRNREDILRVLTRVLSGSGKVLEVSSGSGEHAVYFSAGLAVSWQPTDLEVGAVNSIEAHRAAAGTENMLPAKRLDVRDSDWGEAAAGATAVVCINMIHIAPWRCCEALMAGAQRTLQSGQLLITYGPYLFGEGKDAPSNLAFDASLRQRDPSWGVRRLEDVSEVAAHHDLSLLECVAMPANNHVLVFQRL